MYSGILACGVNMNGDLKCSNKKEDCRINREQTHKFNFSEKIFNNTIS